MSFNIVLFKNESENNRVDKTLTELVTITGELRGECSILDPIIRVIFSSNTDIKQVNYMYIATYGRYYFIRDIRAIRTGVYDISAHVDVLQTYSAGIKAQSAVIRRQENVWNLRLDDGVFKAQQNPRIIQRAFPNGFTTSSYVLAIAGGNQ